MNPMSSPPAVADLYHRGRRTNGRRVRWCSGRAGARSLRRDYPNLDFNQVRILLLEASSRLLTGTPEHLHQYSYKHLKQMGVDVS